MLNELYKDTPKMISFLLCILIIGSIAGGELAFTLLALLVLGQILFNPTILQKIPFFGA
jgi:predicted esterase YcpF (UPF0227 family)